MGRGERGQAAVESALTIPMLVFALLGILQVAMAYHARILTEYAAYKAARSASVYRLSCDRMKKAALMALVPSMGATGASACNFMDTSPSNAPTSAQGWSPSMQQCVRQKYTSVARKVLGSNLTKASTPIVYIKYRVSNPRFVGQGSPFDTQLDSGDPMKVHVRVAYFYEYRIPFVNWILAKYWLMLQTGIRWAQYDPALPIAKANTMSGAGGGGELVTYAQMAINRRYYTTPIISSWSMRMMSDLPSNARTGNNNEVQGDCL